MRFDDTCFEEILEEWMRTKSFDPKAALRLADEMLLVADGIGACRRARALSVKAKTFEELGAYERSESLYDVAEKLVEDLGDSATYERADIFRRKAALRSKQFRVMDALKLADQANALYEEGGDPHWGSSACPSRSA